MIRTIPKDNNTPVIGISEKKESKTFGGTFPGILIVNLLRVKRENK